MRDSDDLRSTHLRCKEQVWVKEETCPVALKRIVEDEENTAEISVFLGLWPTKLCITDVSEEVQNEDASVETGQIFWIYRAFSYDVVVKVTVMYELLQNLDQVPSN